MNILMLSFDSSLLLEGAAVQREARRRQLRYLEELRRRIPGSRVWIVVRSAAGMASKGTVVNDGPELYAAPSSTLRFISAAYRQGRQLCGQHGIDLLTSQSPFSDGLAAWWLRSRCPAKWLVQLHISSLDNPYWVKQSRANHVRAWLGKFLLRRADAVRVVSESAALWLQAKLDIEPEKIFVIPVGTELVTDAQVAPRQRHAAPTVLFVGRLIEEKGVPILLRAFQQVKGTCPDARLVIVGDGPERATLQELASRLDMHDSVQFAGWVPYEQLPEFYRNARVVVLPSLHESYGRVIAEAMSFGRAVIATDTEGARGLILDGQTGFIVPVRDVRALASKVGYILCNPEVAHQVGEAGRQFIQRTQDPQALCAAQVDMWLKVAGR
jgi:glycosyltransferase involved in cell wall biosynthesis